MNQFHDFIIEFAEIIAEEEREKYRWEFFLHKVYDKTYEEYLRLFDGNTSQHSMSNDEMLNIISDSKNIADSY